LLLLSLWDLPLGSEFYNIGTEYIVGMVSHPAMASR
jgi:hypothetical protein